MKTKMYKPYVPKWNNIIVDEFEGKALEFEDDESKLIVSFLL